MSKKDAYEEGLRPLFASPQPGRLTALGCPDCRGVLAVAELGTHGYLRFACQIGHVFSAQALLSSKETELEDCLWSAAEAAKELSQLCAALAACSAVDGVADEARRLEQRSTKAGEISEQVHVLIHEPSTKAGR